VIRALMILLGAVLVLVLGAAVLADPHLWAALIATADHQARMHGNQLDSHLARLAHPSPGMRSTP